MLMPRLRPAPQPQFIVQSERALPPNSRTRVLEPYSIELVERFLFLPAYIILCWYKILWWMYTTSGLDNPDPALGRAVRLQEFPVPQSNSNP